MREIIKLLFFICAVTAFGKDHIATQADVTKYGSHITPGDLIIDSKSEDGKVHHYFMVKEFPNIRENAVVWFDADMLGEVGDIVFRNGPGNAAWTIKSATFKPMPGMQVRARTFECYGLLNVTVTGSNHKYKGLYGWDGVFLTGRFGFVMSLGDTGHGFNISVLNGGRVTIDCIESSGGFSGLRFQEASGSDTATLYFQNFYFHDTVSGEGLYLGRTTTPPVPRLRLFISNGIIVRTAAEGLQFQHLIESDVHNITMFAIDTRFQNAFGPFQDTGIQWNIAAGENKLYNIILDGYASNGLQPFGSPHGGNARAIANRILLFDGRATAMYLHKSGMYGTVWQFKNMFIGGFNGSYSTTGRKSVTYAISSRNGTDKYEFDSIHVDQTKLNLFQNATGITVGTIIPTTITAPKYRNSGFYEPANRIKLWSQYFGAYHDNATNTPTQWAVGDIAIDRKLFYKCIGAHASNATRPNENSNFKLLTWDTTGTRSDQPSWNQSSPQLNYPPDDFRLAHDDKYRLLNMGYIDPEIMIGQPYIVPGGLEYRTNTGVYFIPSKRVQ